MAKTERTLVLIKPPLSSSMAAVSDILGRYLRKGLKIIAFKETMLTATIFDELYGEHRERPYFFLMARAYRYAKFVAVCLEGDGAVDLVRATNGATRPLEADMGTIRRDYGDFELTEQGFSSPYNAVHGSDSIASAEREIKIFFPEL